MASSAGPEFNPSNLSFFNKQANPSNLYNGMKKGLGHLSTGLVAFLGLLIAGPYQGISQGYKLLGVAGVLPGLIAGILGGAITGTGALMYSLSSCVYYLTLGLIRTPMAIYSASLGKQWDKDADAWVAYDMQVEQELLLTMKEDRFVEIVTDKGSATSVYRIQPIPSSAQLSDGSQSVSQSSKSASSPKRHVEDRTLYDLLGVEPEATSSEIKKAYYLKARENHPDRNPDDLQAKERFQKISQAYQVLGDEALRSTYDSKGQSAVESNMSMDAGMLYMMIFGSENFEPIIGELYISTQIKLMTEATKPVSDVLRFRQRVRELKCAVALAHRIDGLVDGDEPILVEKLQTEVAELSNTPLGAVLVIIIGQIYIDRAKAHLSTISSTLSATRNVFSSIYNSFAYVSNGAKTAYSAFVMKSIYEAAQSRQKEEDDRNGVSQEEREARAKSPSLSNLFGPNPTTDQKVHVQCQTKVFSGNLIRLLWQMTRDDIESTLRHVCTKILTDNSVSMPTRNRRARILLLIGEQYSKNEVSPSYALDEFLTRLGRQTGLFAGDESTEYNPFADQNEGQAADGSGDEEEKQINEIKSKGINKSDLLVMLSEVESMSIKQLKERIIALEGQHADCLEKKDLVMRLNSLIADRLNAYEATSLD